MLRRTISSPRWLLTAIGQFRSKSAAVPLSNVLPRGNLAVLTAAGAIGGFSSIALAFLPVYFTALGGSITQYGYVTALATIVAIPSTIFGGVIVPRFGLRRIAIITSWLGPALLMGYFYSGDWIGISITMILASGAGIGSIASRQLIADATTARYRAGQLSLYQTLIGLPAMFSPGIGGYLVSTMGIHEGFKLAILAAVATSIASTALIIRFLRETNKTALTLGDSSASKSAGNIMASANEQGEMPMGKSARILYPFQTFFKNSASLPRALLPLLAAYFMVIMANSTTGPYLIFYATKIAKMDSFQWGLILSLQLVLANLIRTPLGMIVDKFDKRSAIFLSIILTAPLASFFVFVNSFWAILGISLAMVATGIYYTPTHESLQIELTPRDKRPALFAIYDVLSNLSKFGGVLLGGILFAISYTLPFYTFSIIELAAAALIAVAFIIPRKKMSIVS